MTELNFSPSNGNHDENWVIIQEKIREELEGDPQSVEKIEYMKNQFLQLNTDKNKALETINKLEKASWVARIKKIREICHDFLIEGTSLAYSSP